MKNFRFKKSLGQHFLRDKKTLIKIINLSQLNNKTIVEIGPGDGALTKMILSLLPMLKTVKYQEYFLEQLIFLYMKESLLL